MRPRARISAIAGLVLLSWLAVDGQQADLVVIDRIKREAFERSQVMEHLRYLTDVHGPRLTGSPQFDEAAAWAIGRLKEYGLANVHLDRWGPFGRSWSVEGYAVEQRSNNPHGESPPERDRTAPIAYTRHTTLVRFDLD